MCCTACRCKRVSSISNQDFIYSEHAAEGVGGIKGKQGGRGGEELLGLRLWHCECQTPITLIRARICMIKRIRDFNQKNSLVWKRDTLRRARLTHTPASASPGPPVSPLLPPRSELPMNMHGPAERQVPHWNRPAEANWAACKHIDKPEDTC